MLSVAAWRFDRTSSNTVRDTNTAVKMFDSNPMVRVVANPRIELAEPGLVGLAAVTEPIRPFGGCHGQ